MASFGLISTKFSCCSSQGAIKKQKIWIPNLDIAAATENGVLVAHSDFANPRLRSVRDATPEFAWGLMIATVRNLAEEHRRMRDGGWQASTGMTLSGKTLGLLGLGRIGKIHVQ